MAATMAAASSAAVITRPRAAGGRGLSSRGMTGGPTRTLSNDASSSAAAAARRRRPVRGSRGYTSIVATAVTTTADAAGFELMAASRDRRYYMVGGKGGVGKTSLSSSLAVKFAMSGHPTLLVSTDPAHSLTDSLAQDVTGGMPVAVEGTDMMLYAMEVDPDQAKAEFAAFAKTNDMGAGAKNFMSSVGLGGFADQLGDLKLGELLDTPPPGLDEAIAIAKVVQFIKDDKYAKFTRIVFDTAPTGHTLRLLSLPDFLDASIGKIVRLRQKLTSATDAVKGLFGVDNQEQDEAVAKLEALKAQLNEVKDLFRNEETTEFVIVTIPTVLGISESSRLLQSLRKENVPAHRLVVNQIIQVTGGEFAGHKAAVTFCTTKSKDQRRAMEMLETDAGLRSLQRIEAPLFDMEIRGVPALQFMGNQVWT